MPVSSAGLRLDLGCGTIKKQDTIGLDVVPSPAVDVITNIETNPLPFADRSVAYIHSSHFLEHTTHPERVFQEVSRVCTDNARLEFWTPHVWDSSAFVLGHSLFFTDEIYLHICVKYYDYWVKILNSRWILHELQYVIYPDTLVYLKRHGISLDFALRHMHNVAYEFCAHMTVRHDDRSMPPPPFNRTFSLDRFAPRYEIRTSRSATATDKEIERAIREFASGGALPPL